jgi:hypothetical protein
LSKSTTLTKLTSLTLEGCRNIASTLKFNDCYTIHTNYNHTIHQTTSLVLNN